MEHYGRALAHAIRAYRKRTGISQAALGELVGIKQDHVSRLESSQSASPTIRLDVFVRLCRLLAKSPNVVLGFREVDIPDEDQQAAAAVLARMRDQPESLPRLLPVYFHYMRVEVPEELAVLLQEQGADVHEQGTAAQEGSEHDPTN